MAWCRSRAGIGAFLAFFANHPQYVELLIQEARNFKDRKRPTYFEHRDVNVQRWQKLYTRLIAEGRVREMPPDRITDVVGNLMYGTMFTNFFAGPSKPVEQQARHPGNRLSWHSHRCGPLAGAGRERR